MKISIIMPTYNDCESIIETLDTLTNQTYKNWELIIVDDGSTDATREVINNYKSKKDKEDKIKYYYQENKDQLNAILNGINYITGDYVYILHSDDLLNEKDTLEKCIKYMKENPTYDAIIADLITIDANSKITGMQKVLEYKKKDYILPLQLLWLGRNLYVDFAFHKKESFIKNVKESYLTWNIPFWIIQNDKCKLEQLNVKKVDFQFIKYRIHEGNYINNYKGKLNVINGELRTVVTLMKQYNIPLYKIQYLIFRIFNKLKMHNLYRPIYSKKEQKNKGKIIGFVIKKRFGNEYVENKFLKSLVSFYKKQDKRAITIKSNIEQVYQGKDMRKFNNLLVDNKLEQIYTEILDEMEKGFSKIIIENKDDLEKIKDICKFLCIYPFVEIEVK